EAALGRPGTAIQVGGVESFGLGYAAIYVGVAEAALDFAIDYAKKRVVKPENIAVAQDPTVQRHIGGLAVRLDAARLVLEDSAARWESAEIAERGNLANKAKFLATETSLEVTSKVIQVVGGRGGYQDHADERAINGAKAYMKSKNLTSLKLNMMMPSIFTAGSTGEMANFEKATGIGVNYFEVGILQIQAKAMSEAVAKSGSFDFWIGDPI